MTMLLSDEAVALVRRSAEIGDAMVQAMVDTAGPGVSEAEVYAAGMFEGYRRGRGSRATRCTTMPR